MKVCLPAGPPPSKCESIPPALRMSLKETSHRMLGFGWSHSHMTFFARLVGSQFESQRATQGLTRSRQTKGRTVSPVCEEKCPPGNGATPQISKQKAKAQQAFPAVRGAVWALRRVVGAYSITFWSDAIRLTDHSSFCDMSSNHSLSSCQMLGSNQG